MDTKQSTNGSSTENSRKSGIQLETDRREFLAGLAGTAILAGISSASAMGQSPDASINIARVAVPSSVSLASENKISALNDGFAPPDSFDRSHGIYALRRSRGTEQPWVQYEWSEPVSIDKVEVYWAIDRPRPARIPGSGWPSLRRTGELSNSLLERQRLCPCESAGRKRRCGACVQWDEIPSSEDPQTAS